MKYFNAIIIAIVFLLLINLYVQQIDVRRELAEHESMLGSHNQRIITVSLDSGRAYDKLTALYTYFKLEYDPGDFSGPKAKDIN